MPVVLVTVVQAIVVAVTDVDTRNAVAVVAREQISKAGASLGLAVIWRLVGTITAIVIAIAVPSGGNAAMIGTTEAVRGTSALTAV